MFSPNSRGRVRAALLGLLLACAGPQQTSVQSYTVNRVAIGGGGFITWLIVHPTVSNLVYARSDTAGLFRWDGAEWTNLCDWMSLSMWGDESCSAFAIDPNPGSDTITSSDTQNGRGRLL
jgi:hypothetical protein